MRKLLLIIVLIFIPSMAFADGLAIGVFVLKKSDYDSLIKTAGDIRKVDTQQLWKHEVLFRCLPEKKKCHTRYTFKTENKNYRLYVARVKSGKAIYSIIDVSIPEKDSLVCAGTVSADEDVKKDTEEEPFVVVFRKGNFLKH